MKCLECGKENKYPNFKCESRPGNHKVESKLYVYSGSVNIQNIKDRRKFAPEVTLKADTEATAEDGTKIRTQRLAVRFNDARYVTEDPEEQYYLENVAAKKFPIIWGDGAEETWRKNQLTPEQQTAIVQDELKQAERKLKETNELLANVKSQKSGAANARV
jgi:hypothetical protein